MKNGLVFGRITLTLSSSLDLIESGAIIGKKETTTSARFR